MKRSPKDEKQFETDVRTIARQLWNTNSYSGAITLEGRERDSIFVTEEVVHYIEMTTGKSEKKATDDIKKISDFLPKLSAMYPGKLAKGWWITLYEPSGEQGAVVARAPSNIFHCTYHQFMGKLIDSRNYISLRKLRSFGSARNVLNDTKDIPADEYVPAILVDGESGSRVYYNKFKNSLTASPKKCLITGEFGVGKSMLARQIFFDLSEEHRAGRDHAFPVYINLREHGEQKDPDECLMRHAKSVGYPSPDQLVRAWLAGYVNLILDGFDELPPILATRDTGRAKEIRRAAMELVRRFIAENPKDAGIIILGRSNFFDNSQDLITTLGVRKDWQILSIPDFTDQQVTQYLFKKGIQESIPSWLPRRPLLIGYMIGKNLLTAAPDGGELDRVSGWKSLIRLVCEREVEQIHLALETNEMVQIYARIGTKSRRKVDALGPISLVECRDAFFDITKVEPEGRALNALMRLPGLVGADLQKIDEHDVSHTQPGARWFVDDAFQSAVSSEDVFQSVINVHAFDHSVFTGVRHQLSDLGRELMISKLSDDGRSFGHLCGALQILSERAPANPVLVDIFNAIQDFDGGTISPKAELRNLAIPEIIFLDTDADLSNIIFRDCYFERCAISATDLTKIPMLVECYIESMESHHNQDDILRHFQNKVLLEYFSPTYVGYEDYRHVSDDAKLMALSSILDKIFIQSKTGRLESALKRGLPPEQLGYVASIIDILKVEGYINKVRRRGETIWVPDLAYRSQVRAILRNPDASDADIVQKIRNLD